MRANEREVQGGSPERWQLFNRVVLHSSWEGRLVARGISLFVISYLVAHLLRRHALHDGQLNACSSQARIYKYGEAAA